MNHNHHQAPIYDALIAYARKVMGNFHVPGHKQGKAFDPIGMKHFANLLNLDMTEVANLDDLHDTDGVIAIAQQLAADAFGAEETIFLVGGTTAGNLASVLSLCRPGEEILVQRSSHQSVFHGCLLAGARPVYLGASIDPLTGFEMSLTADQVVDALCKYPSVKGVFITSPSYYGVAQPIAEIASVCQRFAVPLIVDEAHGAHFVTDRSLPPTAMQSGADIAIQSTHKMLSAMTMSSMLHMQGSRIQKANLLHWLRVIESSSPSYPLMASLDLARRDLVLHGKARFASVSAHLSDLRTNLKQLENLIELAYQKQQDPFKMSLMASNGQISGYELAAYLQEQDLYTELADEHRVLLAFSFGTTAQECKKLWEALIDLDQSFPRKQDGQITKKTNHLWQSTVSRATYSYEQLRQASRHQVALHEAVGEVAAEMITPYPPGIPAILPGETISQAWVDRLRDWIRHGSKVRGVSNGLLQNVWIMRM